MTETTSSLELNERLKLIETMLLEGRRSTESWGWTFVLWGVAYFVAIAWVTWGGNAWVWPVTMLSAAALTVAIGTRRGRGQPDTTMGRAVYSIWIAVGTSMLVIFPALGISGLLNQHLFVGVVAAMLGAANGASGLILRWKMQMAAAVVWWATSATACFGNEQRATAVFLAALFLCQIVFGAYAMTLEARRHRANGAAHA